MSENLNLPIISGGAAAPSTVHTKHGMFAPSAGGDTSGFGGLVQSFTIGAPSARPYGGDFDVLADAAEEAIKNAGLVVSEVFEKVVVAYGEMTFFVHREHLRSVAQMFRDEPTLRFEMCMGVNGVHYPFEEGRELHAVYPLLSLSYNRRVRLEVAVPDADPHIPSIVDIYPANNWHERETWDFFGIIFDGHPALTRIEMPDDWPGHPQRKDYPLGGIDIEYKGATISAPDKRRSYS